MGHPESRRPALFSRMASRTTHYVASILHVARHLPRNRRRGRALSLPIHPARHSGSLSLVVSVVEATFGSGHVKTIDRCSLPLLC
jgi:hypothetical protein